MTFRHLIDEIRQLLLTSLTNLGYSQEDFNISEPPRKEFGDLTCNVAFLLSKKIKKKPFDIANEIIREEINPYIERKKVNGSMSFILSVDSHPSGYINFKANIVNLASHTLNAVLENSNYGFFNIGHCQKIIIEHTSINPNKALHVGHLRNLIIGDMLYRILKATNYETRVLNYIDDSGLQVADIVVGFKFAGLPLYPKDKSIKFDQYCGDEIYVKVNEMYKDDHNLEEKRRLVLKEIEQGTSEIAKFALEISVRVLRDQLKTCWRMKAHYDLLNFESHIVLSGLWSKSFELLKENCIATLQTQGKNKNCWVIMQDNEEEKVIVRSDGTVTYIAKDIPYAAWKLGLVKDPFFYYKFADQWDGSILWATTLDPNVGNNEHPFFNSGERVITVIDSRQARLQKIITNVLSRLQAKNDKHYYHLAYEAVTLSSETAKSLGLDIGDRQFMHISGRRGIYVNADYILNKLQVTAYKEVKKRNPDLSESDTNRIAEEISISAIRYNLIKQDLDKIITFDIVNSLSLEGNTGPYLQYTYARSQRILEKYGEKINSGNFNLLAQEYEVNLIKIIAKMDLVIEETVKTLNPTLPAKYAYDLATAFNLFYEKVPVLREKNNEIMLSRLALVKSFGMTLRNIFSVLGISALNRM